MGRPRTADLLNVEELREMLVRHKAKARDLRKQRRALVRELTRLDLRIQALSATSAEASRPRNARRLADMIADVLGTAAGPMRVRDIADAVRAAGYQSVAADFRTQVNLKLIKDDRFVSAGRGFYRMIAGTDAPAGFGPAPAEAACGVGDTATAPAA